MSKTVLVIEDDFLLGDLYLLTLSRAGFAVQLATDGKKGVEMAKEGFDLILLDILLPQMNGIDVLKVLKSDERTASIPVILLSNLAQENIIKEGIKLGASGYWLKMEVMPQQLVKYINTFLSQTNPPKSIITGPEQTAARTEVPAAQTEKSADHLSAASPGDVHPTLTEPTTVKAV